MRHTHFIAAVVVILQQATAIQDTSLIDAVAILPTCAVSCITTVIPKSPCSLGDKECICTNSTFLHQVQGCVLSSCSIQESLSTQNITTSVCGAQTRDASNETRLSNIILSIITAFIGVVRLLYNAILSPLGWGLDDSMLLAILVAGAPSVVIIDRMSIPSGLGKDVWTLSISRIETFARSIYALEILYFLQVALLKATLLFFFLKIFPRQLTKRLIKYTLWFNALLGMIFTIVAIFPCRPIHFYWSRFGDKMTAGKCVDINALVWVNAAISIVLDFWMLAIPLHEVIGLEMSWRKRAGVVLMFVLGTFVTIVSIIRLRFLVTFAKGNNPTWDQVNVVQWSNIEINVGIICACMPTLRLIVTHHITTVAVKVKNQRSRTANSLSTYTSKNSIEKGSSCRSIVGDTMLV